MAKKTQPKTETVAPAKPKSTVKNKPQPEEEIEQPKEQPKKSTSVPKKSTVQSKKPIEQPSKGVDKTTKSSKVAKPKKEDELDLSFITIWAKKMKKKAEDIEAELHKQAAKIQKKFPNMGKEEVYGKARMRIFAMLKSELNSPARSFYVRKIYKAAPFDFGEWKRNKALEIYKNNPKHAKDNHFVSVKLDARGKKIVTPTDNVEFYGTNKNKNFEKPLPEHAWGQSIGVIAIPVKDYNAKKMEQMRYGEISLDGQYADPTNEDYYLGNSFGSGWCEIALNVKKHKNDKGEYIENTEMWELKPASNSDIKPVDIKDLTNDQIINIYNNIFVPLIELNEYHEAMVEPQHKEAQEKNEELNKTNSNELMVTKGQVIDIQLSDGTNSHKVVIDVEDNGFGEEEEETIPQSTSVWLDKSIDITFGRYSQILVFGNTSRARKKDFTTNEYLDDWGQTGITGKGYHIIELVSPDGDDEETEDEDYEYVDEVEVDEEEEESEDTEESEEESEESEEEEAEAEESEEEEEEEEESELEEAESDEIEDL
jgi:hypothetical protein